MTKFGYKIGYIYIYIWLQKKTKILEALVLVAWACTLSIGGVATGSSKPIDLN